MITIKEFIQTTQKDEIAIQKDGDTITVFFYGRIPSKKNGQTIRYKKIGKCKRLPFITPGEAHKKWEAKQKQRLFILRWEIIRAANIKMPIEETKEVKITLYIPDKRRTDTINKAESILDILTDAEMIKDDNVEVIPRLVLEYEYRKNRGGAKVEITINKD